MYLAVASVVRYLLSSFVFNNSQHEKVLCQHVLPISNSLFFTWCVRFSPGQ